MTKKDRRLLIEALNTAIYLYVPPSSREHFAEIIADKLDIEFKNHFIEACIAP